MYLKEAIAQADALRPNTVGDELKAQWIEDLEMQFAETQQIQPRPASFPDDKELLMPRPVDQVYVYWLAAKIDHQQADTELYAIDMAMYNQAFKDAIAWWRRHNIPIITASGSRWEP